MLYIVSGELVPEANTLYHGRMTAVRKYDRIFNWYFCDKNIEANIHQNTAKKRLKNLLFLLTFEVSNCII